MSSTIGFTVPATAELPSRPFALDSIAGNAAATSVLSADLPASGSAATGVSSPDSVSRAAVSSGSAASADAASVIRRRRR